MRYALLRVTAQVVKEAGGSRIKEGWPIGVVFATLTNSQAERLRAGGALVCMVLVGQWPGSET